jgi:AraC-like DNA-binding protein
MAVVFDTTAVNPQERFEYWRDAARHLFLPFRVEREDIGPFQARSWMYDLCGIKITRTVSDPTVVIRTARDIAERDPESLTVVVSLRGHTTGRQADRTSSWGPGDITLWDSSKPYMTKALGPATVLTFALPKSMLRRDAARLSTQTALPIEATSCRSGLVRPYLCRLAESLLSLVPVLYASANPVLPGADLLLQVKSYIEHNLSDAQLNADQVSQAHFISRRYLYRIFEAEQVGVSEWIRLRRLQQCASDLVDPARAHESVFGIALRWGFANPAHFSRCFRATYGLAPREYRDAAASHAINADPGTALSYPKEPAPGAPAG